MGVILGKGGNGLDTPRQFGMPQQHQGGISLEYSKARISEPEQSGGGRVSYSPLPR